MDKRRIKRSVVTCAVLVGLSVSPQAQAGWLSDRWDHFTDNIDKIIDDVKDYVDDKIVDPFEDLVGDALEDAVVFALQKGAGKGADYMIGLFLKLDGLDGHIIFDLLVKLMGDERIITDQIMMEMMYNPNMVGLIEKSISAANSDAEKMERANEFFAVSVERFMPILTEGKIQIDIDKIPSSVFSMFSNLGSIENNNDGLELAWENMLRQSMSSGEAAQAFFGMLMQLKPQYQKAMMDFMFLGKIGDAEGAPVHTAESVNFIQAMVEGMMQGMEAGTLSQESLGGLVQSLMPILATFDDQGNMTGMTPYGERFFTVVASKAFTCQDPYAGQFAQMMAQMMPPGMILPVVTNQEVCGRVEDIDAIALINSGNVTYMDSDGDGIPDFMDPTPYPPVVDPNDTDGDGIPNEADADEGNDGVTDDGQVDIDGDGWNDAYDPDIDGDGILNEADADINGDGVMDNGPDTDNDGINDAHDSVDDTDTDNDGIPDTADADIDGDGIPNEADADINGDGIMDNGPDTDNDGTNDAYDADIDGDGIPNEADADINGDGVMDNGPDTDNDGINDAHDSVDDTDTDNDGIPDTEDDDIDGDGILNEADADINGDGVMDNGPDTDNDGINNAHDDDIDGDGLPNISDSDIDGDGLANDIDADADADGTIDDGKTDTDGDGIVDDADADADGDGEIDEGKIDDDGDGIDDGADSEITADVKYYYGEDGVLRDSSFNPVINEKYSDEEKVVTHLTVVLPGNKRVVMNVPMDMLYTDEEGNRIMVSDDLDGKGSRFVISMTTDGFGRVFIGNDEGGFEMSGNLAGMKDNEYLTFSVEKTEDGKLIGKTTIIPKDKALEFGSSAFQQ